MTGSCSHMFLKMIRGLAHSAHHLQHSQKPRLTTDVSLGSKHIDASQAPASHLAPKAAGRESSPWSYTWTLMVHGSSSFPISRRLHPLGRKTDAPARCAFFLLSLFSRMISHPGMPTAEGGLWHIVHSILKLKQSLETITVCLGWRGVLGCRIFGTKTGRVLYKTSWSPYLFPAFPPSHKCSKGSSQGWESLRPVPSEEKSEVRRVDL